jgi:hypothetical protein
MMRRTAQKKKQGPSYVHGYESGRVFFMQYHAKLQADQSGHRTKGHAPLSFSPCRILLSVSFTPTINTMTDGLNTISTPFSF